MHTTCRKCAQEHSSTWSPYKFARHTCDEWAYSFAKIFGQFIEYSNNPKRIGADAPEIVRYLYRLKMDIRRDTGKLYAEGKRIEQNYYGSFGNGWLYSSALDSLRNGGMERVNDIDNLIAVATEWHRNGGTALPGERPSSFDRKASLAHWPLRSVKPVFGPPLETPVGKIAGPGKTRFEEGMVPISALLWHPKAFNPRRQIICPDCGNTIGPRFATERVPGYKGRTGVELIYGTHLEQLDERTVRNVLPNFREVKMYRGTGVCSPGSADDYRACPLVAIQGPFGLTGAITLEIARAQYQNLLVKAAQDALLA